MPRGVTSPGRRWSAPDLGSATLSARWARRVSGLTQHWGMNVIEATGLKKRFGRTQALAGVDLVARQGTVLGVLGPNGAGKTTAVRVLATLLQPDGGPARIGGYDGVHEPQKVRETIGLTGQYASV